MLKLGQYQKLTIAKKVEFGVYLAEEQDMEKRVLLPAKQVPENAKIPFHQSHVFLNRRIELGVLYQFIDRSKYQCKRSTDFMGDIGEKL